MIENTGIDIQVIVTALVGLFTSVVSSVVTWFLTRRKYIAEVDSSVIDNMQQSLEFYMKLSEDNKERLDSMITQNADLKKKNDELEKEVRELRQQIFELMTNICYNLQCTLRERDKEPNVKPLKNTGHVDEEGQWG